MSCTLRSRCGKGFIERLRWSVPGAGAASPLLILVAAFSGCAAGGQLHPEFSRLEPHIISVSPVGNATIADLKAVSFGGLLQRAVVGVETHDIQEILRASLEEALVKLGYALAPASQRSGGAVAGAPAADAVLDSVIEAWYSETTASSPVFACRYRLELRRTSGEVLYSGTFRAELRESQRAETLGAVPRVLRRSAQAALSGLPPATLSASPP